mgnify:FL=1
MKEVLVLAHDDVGQEARLQAALDLTRAVGGHLACVQVVELPMIAGDIYGLGLSVDMIAEAQRLAAKNRARIEARLKIEDISWDWQETTGYIAESMLRAADLADIIVVNRLLEEAFAPNMRGIAGTLALRSRKPVVAVAENVRRLDVGGRALIAWDCSLAAITAMKCCIPLLKLASAVEIFTVGDVGSGRSAETGAILLSRHGIHAEIKCVANDKNPIEVRILSECNHWNADYCVMGAYSGNEIIEYIFGGVTKYMLTESNIPVILGH